MIRLVPTKTANTAHTQIFASVWRQAPFLFFLGGGGWGVVGPRLHVYAHTRMMEYCIASVVSMATVS